MFNYCIIILKFVEKSMKDIKRIVIPVDKTESSKNAVRRGAFFAKILGIDAKIVSVNDTHQFMSSVVLEEKLRKEAEAALDGYKKIGEDLGVTLETVLISGDPAEEIVKFAKEDDLIVIVSDREKPIDGIILGGSVSKNVIRNAPCSVLVVK